MTTDNRNKILILGAGALQVPAIIESKKMGLYTIVVDYDNHAIGVKYADKFCNISTLDAEAVFNVAKTEHVDGILTICTDRPVSVVSKVGNRLGLNTISEETAFRATNKCAMRDALSEHGVPIPNYRTAYSYDEYVRAVNEIGTPCICKPADNSGSRGVNLIDNKDDNLKLIFEHAQNNSLDGQILLEEYMIGPEVSVEIMVENDNVNVIQITDKITTGAPHFVEMGHTQPSKLSNDVKSDIQDVAINAVKAIGIDKGPAHVELIITDNGPKIVELGARLGGDYITTNLVPLSTGYNMVRANIRIAMGLDGDEKIMFNHASAIRYFNNECPIFFERDILEMMESFYVSFDQHKDLESSLDRTGYFIIQAENLDELNYKITEIGHCL